MLYTISQLGKRFKLKDAQVHSFLRTRGIKPVDRDAENLNIYSEAAMTALTKAADTQKKRAQAIKARAEAAHKKLMEQKKLRREAQARKAEAKQAKQAQSAAGGSTAGGPAAGGSAAGGSASETPMNTWVTAKQLSATSGYERSYAGALLAKGKIPFLYRSRPRLYSRDAALEYLRAHRAAAQDAPVAPAPAPAPAAAKPAPAPAAAKPAPAPAPAPAPTPAATQELSFIDLIRGMVASLARIEAAVTPKRHGAHAPSAGTSTTGASA